VSNKESNNSQNVGLEDYNNISDEIFPYFTTPSLKIILGTDYGRPVRKLPLMNGRKSTPTPKFLGTAKAYFVCHIGPNFQIFLIYAFIGCP
jgi:hypothetical protein